jgi:hypothetical protein
MNKNHQQLQKPNQLKVRLYELVPSPEALQAMAKNHRCATLLPRFPVLAQHRDKQALVDLLSNKKIELLASRIVVAKTDDQALRQLRETNTALATELEFAGNPFQLVPLNRVNTRVLVNLCAADGAAVTLAGLQAAVQDLTVALLELPHASQSAPPPGSYSSHGIKRPKFTTTTAMTTTSSSTTTTSTTQQMVAPPKQHSSKVRRLLNWTLP